MASTRTSFRPRPVDISRQLNIVRDIAELDKTDDLEQGQTPATVPAEQAPPTGHQKKKKEVKEIPVPEVRIIPGYTREYLPLFRIPDTYIRSKAGVAWSRDDYCEYDLDNEDEDWLEAFNVGGANRLSEEKFEAMLWRLEVTNAEANQRLMSEPGYSTDWRMLPAAVAATANMSRDEALAALRKYACARDAILHAVYDYWRGKRERWGKPIMRRLQAPTNPSDANPYNVFRPREKVNRPQTRRRRENTHDCLDKMRQIRESMLRSLELTELLTFREARKRDLHRLDVDLQRYQLARHHQPRQQQEAAEADAAAQLRETQARSKQGEARLRAYLDSGGSLGGVSTSYDVSLRRALLRKRRRQEMEGCANGEAIGRLPPAPLPADDEMLMLFSPDFSRLLGQPAGGTAAANGSSASTSSKPLVAAPPGLDLSCTRARIGRCGRPMLTRCDPFTLEPHPPAPPPDAADAGSAVEAGAPPPSPFAARHPLLHSSQQPSLPWAATLDLEWLPEGIADKAMLRAQRERRLNADRLNAALLRKTQLELQQQAAGGIVGATGFAGAAAAAAAATLAGAAAASAHAQPAPPAAAAPAPQRPPPPPAVPNQGAPAGTLPHLPQTGAPAGTLPHVPMPGIAASPSVLPPPAAAQAGGGSGGGAGGPAGTDGTGSLAATPMQPGSAAGVSQPAPGSGGAQARKVPKAGGTPAPGAGAGPAPPSAAAAGGPAPAARTPAPGAPPAVPKPAGTAGPASSSTPAPLLSNSQPQQPQGPTPLGATTPAPLLGGAGAAGPGPGTLGAAGAPQGGVAAGNAGATPVGVTPVGGAATPAGGAGTVKKMLPTSKAVAGPSSASQLKRGPGRPPKAAKATPDGNGLPPPPPSNTTVPMDML